MSPKTLTGEELELDDAPAREAQLFLVDGNNLAGGTYSVRITSGTNWLNTLSA